MKYKFQKEKNKINTKLRIQSRCLKASQTQQKAGLGNMSMDDFQTETKRNRWQIHTYGKQRKVT